MTDLNKYPAESNRRRFVKGVVGAAALSGTVATTAALGDMTTTPQGQGGGPTNYIGTELVGGPAPRGMPQIPVEVDDEGFLRGIWPDPEVRETEGGLQEVIAEVEVGDVTYSTTWFQYCGSQSSPALDPEADMDNYMRYVSAPPRNYGWQSEQTSGGDRVHINDFEDYEEWGNGIGQSGLGKPAIVNWRSQDSGGEPLEPADRLPVQIIRSPRIEEEAEDDEWLEWSTDEGFIAFQNQCTHFCCVPGYKAFPDSEGFNAEDLIYCQCHQSVYDPFTLEEQTFVALPRPE